MDWWAIMQKECIKGQWYTTVEWQMGSLQTYDQICRLSSDFSFAVLYFMCANRLTLFHAVALRISGCCGGAIQQADFQTALQDVQQCLTRRSSLYGSAPAPRAAGGRA